MKLLRTKVVTDLVQQDGTKSGTLYVYCDNVLVMTKQWNGVAELSNIKQEIQAVTRKNQTSVLRLVA